MTGNNKECVTYDQLTMGQWMTVFCRAMREENNENSKDAMLDYLISLLDDANDFSWSSAKASHVASLCRMEQGEIKVYIQTEQIDRVTCTHAKRHTPTGKDTVKNVSKQNSKSMVCPLANPRGGQGVRTPPPPPPPLEK